MTEISLHPLFANISAVANPEGPPPTITAPSLAAENLFPPDPVFASISGLAVADIAGVLRTPDDGDDL